MSNPVSENISPELAELSRRTGLVVRPINGDVAETLFRDLQRYDEAERTETLDYLKQALNETRASLGSEPVFSE